MAEWLKNMCLSPFRYGLDKANQIAVKAISMIFNLYGSRLLKMDMDNIIKSNECVGENDIFYLHPLILKELEQELGLNIIKIEEGIINDLVITVPWKTMLSDATQIDISNILLRMTFAQNDNSIYLSSLEDSNSYFKDKQLVGEKHDLVETYKEIRNILLQYFNKINCKINLVEIILSEHFKITMEAIEYSNNIINIEKATIYADDQNKNTKLCYLNKITIDTENKYLSISEVTINPLIIKFLPEFYTENEECVFNFDIFIGILTMEEICMKDLCLDVSDKNIVLKSITSMDIKNILFLKPDNQLNSEEENQSVNILNYDKKINNILLNRKLYVKLGNINDFIVWSNNFKKLIDSLVSKIIIISLDDDTCEFANGKSIEIINANLSIIHGDDIFEINSSNIFLGKDNKFMDVCIEYNNVTGKFGLIYFLSANEFGFDNSLLVSNDFILKSQHIRIAKTPNDTTISFDGAESNNIIPIIDFVTGIINKFSNTCDQSSQYNLPSERAGAALGGQGCNNNEEQSHEKNIRDSIEIDLLGSTSDLTTTLALLDCDYMDENLMEDKEPYNINLELRNCHILMNYEKINFDIIIDSSNISITNKNAENVSASILMDEYLVAKINAPILSQNYNIIDSIKIFIDPENFDKINYLFGTLTPDSTSGSSEDEELTEECCKQLEKTLSTSIISSSLADLQNKITIEEKLIKSTIINCKPIDIVDFPFLKVLEKSCTDLRKKLIDDYRVENTEPEHKTLEIIIKSSQIYLFDELSKYYSQKKPTAAFLCGIFKEIELKKTISRYRNNKNQKNKLKTKYSLNIKNGAIIDVCCNNLEWKYFVKFSDNVMTVNVSSFDDALRININIFPIKTHIREETLLRLLAFFSNSHHAPDNSKSVNIEHFMISSVNILVNYYPIILQDAGIDVLTLKDFKMILSSQILYNVGGFDKLLNTITDKWNTDINPDNIFQFLPNVKIIQPYARPVMNFINVITKYFKNSNNKKTIRKITKNINYGTSIVAYLIKSGIGHVWELFH